MNLPINMIPRKRKKPPKRNSSGGFLFCPRHQMCCLGTTIENLGLVCPNSLICIPEILHIFVAVIRFSRLPDNRAGEDGCGFHFHDANHWLDISFLFHIYFYYYFYYLMITFMVLPPRFTMFMPFCKFCRRRPWRS